MSIFTLWQPGNKPKTKQHKLHLKKFNGWGCYVYNLNLALFWWYRFYSSTLYKNLDVIFLVVELLLENFSAHFALVPTKRRFDITALFRSFCSEKIEWTSTGKRCEDAICLFSSKVIPSETKIPEMELSLKNPAMTLFFFQILVFCSEVAYTLVSDTDQVAKNPKVSHFDCGAMTENALYALNRARQWHITPEELEISQTKINFYTKHFRKELNATKYRIQYQRENWHYGHNDHSSIDHHIAGITSDLVNSPEQCRSLAKWRMIYLADQFFGNWVRYKESHCNHRWF